MVLYGSNGTGKTIVLFQCLVMLISSLKLKGKEFEVMVIVGAESIKDPICGKSTLKHGLNYCGANNCEESELIYDLKTRYLGNFNQLRNIQPISFDRACERKCTNVFVISSMILFSRNLRHFRNCAQL